jgi:Tol biopolymer transport system component
VLEILDVLATTRSASTALERTIGVDEEKLYQEWSKSLRKHYWPLYPDKVEVVDLGRRLTDHVKDHGYYNYKPVLSPDGRKVAVTNRTVEGEVAIWVLDLEREARSRLTLEGNGILPLWTPDGTQIVFSSERHDSGAVQIYRKAADGTGPAARLLGGDHSRFPSSWTPNGKQLAFTEWHPENMRDIWVLNLEDEEKASAVRDTRFDEHSPIFSPDGRWMAYVSDESGRYEVYVQSHPPGRGRWLVSAGGGTEPVWSADGRELFYRNADAMMAVPISAGADFSAGKPATLFERSLKRGIYDSLSYDVTADGQSFLMIERDLVAAPTQLNVVLDWQEDLQRKVPVGRD